MKANEYYTRAQIESRGWVWKTTQGDYTKFEQANDELYWNNNTLQIIGVFQKGGADEKKE